MVLAAISVGASSNSIQKRMAITVYSFSRILLSVVSLLVFLAVQTMSNTDLQAQDVNYDESKVPSFKLPDPLVFNDGEVASKASDWNRRRKEIVELFKQHVYGTMPTQSNTPTASIDKNVLLTIPGSKVQATLKEVTLEFSKHGPKARLVCFLPVNAEGPCPVFLGYNFEGNHTVCSSKEISMGDVWIRGKRESPTDDTRGKKAGRWPVSQIIESGFGVATLHYGDVDPDFDDSFENGVHVLHPDLQNRPDNWSSIGAWAWGLQRVMDYLETDEAIDAKKVVVFGHSRLGKTALWAGATDSRFSIVISNNSGCGGAALARRRFGEKLSRINTVFPHWFCKKHRDYNDNEKEMPVDQHMLISLIAPRPVYVASAEQDRWADPRGEFLSLFHAQPVFRLLGKAGLELEKPEMPSVNSPLHGDAMGYHVRSGKHDINAYDWEQYLKFCEAEFQSD
jgi:hypothetical protein